MNPLAGVQGDLSSDNPGLPRSTNCETSIISLRDRPYFPGKGFLVLCTKSDLLYQKDNSSSNFSVTYIMILNVQQKCLWIQMYIKFLRKRVNLNHSIHCIGLNLRSFSHYGNHWSRLKGARKKCIILAFLKDPHRGKSMVSEVMAGCPKLGLGVRS